MYPIPPTPANSSAESLVAGATDRSENKGYSYALRYGRRSSRPLQASLEQIGADWEETGHEGRYMASNDSDESAQQRQGDSPIRPSPNTEDTFERKGLPDL